MEEARAIGTRLRLLAGKAAHDVRASLAALGMLALVGLASPFLELQDPLHGGIGLIILLVGIRIAWQLTAEKPIDIVGPFNNSAPPAKAAPG